jgi:hypothetical protein
MLIKYVLEAIVYFLFQNLKTLAVYPKPLKFI